MKNSERSKRSKNRNFREVAETSNGYRIPKMSQPNVRSLNNSEVKERRMGDYPEYDNVQQAILEQINIGSMNQR